MELKVAPVRGVESRGMLVSGREMGISEDHDGIIELPDDAPLGKPFAPLMGLDDPVLEVAVTPNRADCLGVSGIARDLRRRRPRQPDYARAETREGEISLAAESEARLRLDAVALPGVRAPPDPRRQERSLARLAAAAARDDRPQADQRARRHHQLHHPRPLAAAARVRRGQGQGRPRGAPRPQGREAHSARR